MRTLAIAAVGSLLLVGGGNADLTCPSSTTLDTLVKCIREQMPQDRSNGYVAPTPSQRAEWRIIVNQMLQGSCDFAVPVSLNGIVQVRTFTDTGNGRSYCLLMEVRNQNAPLFVDHGFGTFLVYSNATRQLSHQAVHPIFDSNTDIQAVTVFKDTDSRSFLMAGAHRNANSAASACLPDHLESDPSHNVNSMVQATNEELLAYYGAASWFAIQWHGMAATRCPTTDVHLSHGLNVHAPTDKIAVLRDLLLHNSNNSKWRVSLAGESSCDLNATENMQGRLINGVAAERVCRTPASSITQKFIHIEQHMEFRTPSKWIAPLTDAFP
jgi:hypothetical protein